VVVAAFREACEARGLSFTEAAVEAGLDDEVVSLERSGSSLRLGEMASLCAVLRVRLSEVIARAEALALERS
jgi:hypothetical protein